MEFNLTNIINNYSKNDTVGGRICQELSSYSAFGSRFCAASLPFFKLYAPLNQISSNIDNAVLVVTTLRNMASGLKQTNSNTFSIFTSGAVTILSVMNSRCATIISVAYDILNSYQNSEYSQLILNGARFIVIFHPLGLELQVALAVFQIFLEARNAYNQYNKENYLEAIASAALSIIKGYQLHPQLIQLQEKYYPAPQTASLYPQYGGLRWNHCSGQLPEGHTFDDEGVVDTSQPKVVEENVETSQPQHVEIENNEETPQQQEIKQYQEENSSYEQFLDETAVVLEQPNSSIPLVKILPALERNEENATDTSSQQQSENVENQDRSAAVLPEQNETISQNNPGVEQSVQQPQQEEVKQNPVASAPEQEKPQVVHILIPQTQHRIHRGHRGRRSEGQRMMDRLHGTRRRDIKREEKRIEKEQKKAAKKAAKTETPVIVVISQS